MTDKFGQPPQELAWENFIRIRDLMLDKTGMIFDENKYNVVRNVIAERMAATEISDFEAYFRLVSNTTGSLRTKELGTREFRRLVESLAVNETSFFRNREHFNALQFSVLPLLLKRKADKRHLRIWSAGCSTGQEPYSLAMLVVEMLEQRGERIARQDNDSTGWKIEIIATDISEKVLHTAQSGRFRREDMRGILDNKTRLERFFRPINSAEVTTAPLDPAQIVIPGQIPLRANPRAAYEIIPEVRALVRFGYFNLAEPLYPPEKVNTFDLVLCENVMIYFSPEITRQVIENIYRALTDGGFLFIGFSETLWQVSERFRLVNTDETFYYQKPYPGDPPPGRHSRNEPSTGPLSSDRAGKNQTDGLKPRIIELPDRLLDAPREPLRALPVGLDLPTRTPQLPPYKKEPEKEKKARIIPDREQPEKNEVKVNKPPSTTVQPAWQTLLAEGLHSMETDEFENAATTLGEALKVAPREVDVLCAMAHLKVKLSDYEAASEFSRQAIEINPLCEPAHLLLAMIYHHQERIEEAVKEYKQTIYINFGSVIAHMRLGDIFGKQRQTANALREYRNALSALERYAPDDYIEGLPVEILKQTCRNNIRRLQGPSRLR
jgi:chemotaxis protein methyltransferase CheR